MSDNLIVDVNRLNEALARLDKLWTEASNGSVYINGQATGPGAFHTLLNVNDLGDVKIEAATLTNNDNIWTATRNRRQVRGIYKFKTDFTHPPIITVTFAGALLSGVVIGVDSSAGSHHGDDKANILMRRINKLEDFSQDFKVHLIAIGN